MKLSVIIPSYKDPLLQKTIDSLLDNSGLSERLEVVVCLDGYWPAIPLKLDDRVKIVHLGKNRGMRGAINAGVLVSTGEYIMRTDEHCIFGDNYDLILTSQMEDNWIVTPKRYFLDPIKWEVMDIPFVDYEKLVIQKDEKGNEVKFAGQRWHSRDRERKDIMIDETTAMQGSCWVIKRSWWDKVIGELQTEGYGPTYQDSHEMCFKTWQAGGKMYLNKNTWFAHKHRSFPRTHQEGSPENPSNREAGWKYSLEVWKEYYETVIRPRFNL